MQTLEQSGNFEEQSADFGAECNFGAEWNFVAECDFGAEWGLGGTECGLRSRVKTLKVS